MSKDSLVKYHQYDKERQKKACERLYQEEKEK